MTNPKPLTTLLGELDALYAEWARDVPSPALHEQWKALLLSAYRQLREGIERLERTHCVQFCDECEAVMQGLCASSLAAENERLSALVAQQREALRKAFAVADCTSDVRHVARLDDIHAILGAVLATEGDDHA